MWRKSIGGAYSARSLPGSILKYDVGKASLIEKKLRIRTRLASVGVTLVAVCDTSVAKSRKKNLPGEPVEHILMIHKGTRTEFRAEPGKDEAQNGNHGDSD